MTLSTPRTILSSIAATLVLAAVPTMALADDLPPPCDESTYYCVNTTTPEVTPSGPLSMLSAFSNLDLTNGIDTGWLPSCGPSVDHCGTAQYRLSADLSDTQVNLSMAGDIDLYWGPDNGVEAGNILACPRALNNGGTFSGTLTMSPTIGFYLDVGYASPLEFTIDPFELSGLLGGDEFVPASFDVAASGDKTFTPWGFAPGVSAPLAEPMQELLSVPTSQISDDIYDTGGSVSGVMNLSMDIHSGTTNTQFTWVADSMTLSSGGSGYTVSPQDPCALIPFDGGSSIKITTQLKGTLSYGGNVSIQPQITLASVAGFPVSFTYNLNQGAVFPIGEQFPDLTFPQGTATPKTFPLPNLFVQTADTLDFGSVAVGQSKSKTIDIVNNGKLRSIGHVETTDPGQFTVTSASDSDDSFSVNEDGGTDTLTVVFIPSAAGVISATLTLSSNDPDEPTKFINLTAEGTGNGGTGGAAGNAGAAGSAGVAGSSGASGNAGTAGNAGVAGNAGSGNGSAGTNSGQICIPGQQIECACPGAIVGAQACNANGTGYLTCDCGQSGTAGASSSTPAASTDDGGCSIGAKRSEAGARSVVGLGMLAMMAFARSGQRRRVESAHKR